MTRPRLISFGPFRRDTSLLLPGGKSRHELREPDSPWTPPPRAADARPRTVVCSLRGVRRIPAGPRPSSTQHAQGCLTHPPIARPPAHRLQCRRIHAFKPVSVLARREFSPGCLPASSESGFRPCNVCRRSPGRAWLRLRGPGSVIAIAGRAADAATMSALAAYGREQRTTDADRTGPETQGCADSLIDGGWQHLEHRARSLRPVPRPPAGVSAE